MKIKTRAYIYGKLCLVILYVAIRHMVEAYTNFNLTWSILTSFVFTFILLPSFKVIKKDGADTLYIYWMLCNLKK